MKILLLCLCSAISAAIILGIPFIGYPEVFVGAELHKKNLRLALLVVYSLSIIPIAIIIEKLYLKYSKKNIQSDENTKNKYYKTINHKKVAQQVDAPEPASPAG